MNWFYIGETFPQKIPGNKTRFVFMDEAGVVHIGYVDLEVLYYEAYNPDTESFEACEPIIDGIGYIVDNGSSFKDWSDLSCIAWSYITEPSYRATPCSSELSPDQT